jgi:nicotinamide-nucleotide amidase
MVYQHELNDICKGFIRNHHTLSVAESVTSGKIQNAFSNIENASSFYEGGITAYSLNQKCRHLGIDKEHALACNSVSETIAKQMAEGVSNLFGTDWAIGITGYASPVPELGITDLFACYAIIYNHETLKLATIKGPKGEAEEVQEFYVTHILKELISVCKNNHVF